MEGEVLLIPPPPPPRLRHELSLQYNYPDDKEKIGVPLRFRLKYDEVIEALKERLCIHKFEYLLSGGGGSVKVKV